MVKYRFSGFERDGEYTNEYWVHGDHIVKIRVSDIDELIIVTTDALQWAEEGLVAPTDQRTPDGLPIYQVLKLKEGLK